MSSDVTVPLLSQPIRRRLCLLALLAIGSCTSERVAGGGDLGEVRISSATGSPPGFVLIVAAHLNIGATVVNNLGLPVDPQPPLLLSTGDPQVALVTAAGLLTGITAGSTTLRAEVSGSTDYRPASVPVTVIQALGANR